MLKNRNVVERPADEEIRVRLEIARRSYSNFD